MKPKPHELVLFQSYTTHGGGVMTDEKEVLVFCGKNKQKQRIMIDDIHYRQLLNRAVWVHNEKGVRTAFWRLNGGLELRCMTWGEVYNYGRRLSVRLGDTDLTVKRISFGYDFDTIFYIDPNEDARCLNPFDKDAIKSLATGRGHRWVMSDDYALYVNPLKAFLKL